MIAKFKKTKRESWQSLFFSIFLGLALFLIIGFLIVANWRINQRRSELNAQLEVLKKELQILEEEKARLQTQISQFPQESYLEREARERFNLKKPGEEVVVILPSEEKKKVKEEEGFWKEFWRKLKFW